MARRIALLTNLLLCVWVQLVGTCREAGTVEEVVSACTRLAALCLGISASRASSETVVARHHGSVLEVVGRTVCEAGFVVVVQERLAGQTLIV